MSAPAGPSISIASPTSRPAFHSAARRIECPEASRLLAQPTPEIPPRSRRTRPRWLLQGTNSFESHFASFTPIARQFAADPTSLMRECKERSSFAMSEANSNTPLDPFRLRLGVSSANEGAAILRRSCNIPQLRSRAALVEIAAGRQLRSCAGCRSWARVVTAHRLGLCGFSCPMSRKPSHQARHARSRREQTLTH